MLFPHINDDARSKSHQILMYAESVTRTTVTTHNTVIFIVTGLRILNLKNTRLFYIILYRVTKAAVLDLQAMASVTKYRYTSN